MRAGADPGKFAATRRGAFPACDLLKRYFMIADHGRMFEMARRARARPYSQRQFLLVADLQQAVPAGLRLQFFQQVVAPDVDVLVGPQMAGDI